MALRHSSYFYLITYCFFSLSIVEFYALLLPLALKQNLLYTKSMDANTSYACLIVVLSVYNIAVLITIVSTMCCVLIDPIDDYMYNSANESSPMHYCYICDRHIYFNTKHCIVCNKCIKNYDHHCVWLNACIGANNYTAFILSVWSIAGMLLILLVICIFLLVRIILLYSAKSNEIFKLYRLMFISYSGLIAVLLISITFYITTLIFIIQLVVFHTYLYVIKKTTYEYIVEHHNRIRNSGVVITSDDGCDIVRVDASNESKSS